MNVALNTNFTVYNTDVLIKPASSLWTIKNTGSAPIIINNAFVVYQGDSFGVDANNLIIPVIQHVLDKNPNEKIEVVNTTQFSVSFIKDLGGGVTIPDEACFFLLIETSIDIQR